MRFARLLSLSLLASLLALPQLAHAQALTTITATTVEAGGSPATGTMCMRAVDIRGNPISVSKSGGGFYLAGQPFCQTLTSGALVGSLQVPNPITDSAPGHAYDVQVYNVPSGDLIDLGPIYGIGGSSWSLDTYDPTITVPTTAAFTFTQGTGVPSGSCVAPALYVNTGAGSIYVCVAGAWEAASGGGSVTATAMQSAVSGLAGCTTTGYAWNPATNTCTAASGTSLDWSAQGGTLPVQEYVNSAHPPLAYWDAALHSCQNQIVRVQIHGDSRSINDATVTPGAGSVLSVTFAGRWANRLMSQLQGTCGSHGSGVVPLRWCTDCTFGSAGNFNLDYYPTASGTFAATDTALGPYQPDSSDPMLVTATSNGATINFASPVPFDHLLGYCVSGTGIQPWTLYIDSTNVGTCGVASGSKTAVVGTSSAVTLGTHTAKMVCASQPCELYAMEASAGTTGVSIDNVSAGSASAEMFGMYPSTQFAFSDLAPGGVALDIIAHVTNEPGHSVSTSQFQTTLTNIITHDRALAYPPSVLLFSPLQDGISSTAWYPVIKTVATAQSTAFVDLRDRWGSSVVSWLFGPDGDHENNLGDGEKYSAVAQTVIDIPSSGGSGSIATVSCPAGYSVQTYGPSGGTCQINSALPPSACGTGYAHHTTISIASSSVSGGSDLTNYPALVAFNGAATNSITLTNLKTVANGGQVTSSSGLDIIFCNAASGGTQLSHELVAGTYSATTGAAEFHVKVPTVSASVTTNIYPFWGYSGAADTSNHTDVWSNGYVAVYHGGTSSSLVLNDSTVNANNLTNTGATAAAGQFGGAFSVTPSEYLADLTATGVPVGQAARTLEVWVNTAATGGDNILLGTGSSGNNFDIDFQGTDMYTFANGADVWTGSFSSMVGSWHHLAAVVPGGATAINQTLYYKDGVAATTACGSGSCTGAYASTGSVIQLNGGAGYGTGLAPTTALLDEVRVSNVGRSAGWLATQVANQSNPSTFWSVGTIF